MRWTDRQFAIGMLCIVATAYVGSLGGGWVWDDVPQIADPTPFHDPWRLVTMDVWGALNDAPSDLYRPLAVLSHVPGQVAFPGPLVERLVSLALHLLNVGFVAAIAVGLGATRRAAWVAAAIFGLHPMASEAVAWISARHDLLGTTLVLGGFACLLRRRDPWAGLCFALAPFCKEPFLLTPAAVALVAWVGLRRRAGAAVAGSVAGVVAYLAARAVLDLPLPSGGLDAGGWLGALGATALRGLRLLVDPTAPDAFPLFHARPGVGAVAALAGLAGIVAAARRPAIAVVVGCALFVAPGASASAANGFLADRYYYVLLAAIVAAVAGRLGPLSAPRSGLALAFVLGCFTISRAADWTSNEALYGASLAKDPANAHAAFHVAHDLHVRAGDCEAAIPLYRVGMSADPRAGNNLQACLIADADWAAAAAMGPDLMARDGRATPAYNTAYALAALKRYAEAEAAARECLRRDPDHVKARILLGRLLVIGGLPDEAAAEFREALRVDPRNGEAVDRLRRLQ